jgi:hypothetical protein
MYWIYCMYMYVGLIRAIRPLYAPSSALVYRLGAVSITDANGSGEIVGK